jgi:hypothetical protein
MSPEQLRGVDDSRQRLAAISPEVSHDMARWLRDEVTPELPTERQRELAEQSARRFEQRAGNVVAD